MRRGKMRSIKPEVHGGEYAYSPLLSLKERTNHIRLVPPLRVGEADFMTV